MFRVKLAHNANPDIDHRGGYWGGSPPATANGWHPVNTLRDASRECLDFIETFDLGGGNWGFDAGAVIAGGRQVARVSYNGRVWDNRGEGITGHLLDLTDAEFLRETGHSAPEVVPVTPSRARKKPSGRFTSVSAIRAAFFDEYPELYNERTARGAYKATVRKEFDRFVFKLERTGEISFAMARRATLE